MNIPGFVNRLSQSLPTQQIQEAKTKINHELKKIKQEFRVPTSHDLKTITEGFHALKETGQHSAQQLASNITSNFRSLVSNPNIEKYGTGLKEQAKELQHNGSKLLDKITKQGEKLQTSLSHLGAKKDRRSSEEIINQQRTGGKYGDAKKESPSDNSQQIANLEKRYPNAGPHEKKFIEMELQRLKPKSSNAETPSSGSPAFNFNKPLPQAPSSSSTVGSMPAP